MNDTLIIAGRGDSAAGFDWPKGIPIMGVSSGYMYVPEMQHWVSLDRPVNFPDWVVTSDRFDKHVARNKYFPFWSDYPRVVGHEINLKLTLNGQTVDTEYEAKEPSWEAGKPLTPCGPMMRNHSLLFAVQVAAHLGYKRQIFIGVDLLQPELYEVSDVLKSWHADAQAHGIEWLCASDISTLNEWMPRWEAALCASS